MGKYAISRFCENLDEIIFPGEGQYDIPIIYPEEYQAVEWFSYNYALTLKGTIRQDKSIHFFVDDYQFERLWHNWKRYSASLKSFYAVMTPDFSMYTDWPKAIQIYNHYRKHFIGAHMQSEGMLVYPTISWADKSSYDFCFDGEPHNSTVCVSSVGAQNSKERKRLFLDGYNAMMEQLEPKTILFYGAVPKECEGNIIHIKPYTDKFKKGREINVED